MAKEKIIPVAPPGFWDTPELPANGTPRKPPPEHLRGIKRRQKIGFVPPKESFLGVYEVPPLPEIMAILRMSCGSVEAFLDYAASKTSDGRRHNCLWAVLELLQRPENEKEYEQWQRLVRLHEMAKVERRRALLIDRISDTGLSKDEKDQVKILRDIRNLLEAQGEPKGQRAGARSSKPKEPPREVTPAIAPDKLAAMKAKMASQ